MPRPPVAQTMFREGKLCQIVRQGFALSVQGRRAYADGAARADGGALDYRRRPVRAYRRNSAAGTVWGLC